MKDRTVSERSNLILNVDDYEPGCYAVTRVLRQAGFDVIEAGNGAEALRLVAEQRPALVLLDINLPDIGGLEVCRKIKTDPALTTTVLQISASATDIRDQVIGLEGGADGYLVAPADPSILLATVRSLLRLHRTERQLASERDYAESIVDTIREPLLVLDSDLRVRSANRAFYRTFGLHPESTKEQLLTELNFPSGNVTELARLVEETFRNRSSLEDATLDFELPELGRRTFLVSGRRLWRESNQAECILCVLEDITERKQAEEAQLRWNEELQHFTRAASHDLQEPLRMISSFAQLLENCCRKDLDPTGQEYLDVILEGSRRLQGMLQDLLTYARYASSETFPSRSSKTADALRSALENLQVSIEESAAQINWHDLPTLQADASQLTRLFQNLLSNAIKYKSEEPPRISVEATRSAEDWVFSVRDNGMGFPQEQAERIFLPFNRLHGRQIPGSGIGLSICKHIVERHGGRIWAESGKGRGAVFYFTLPATSKVEAAGNHS